MIESTTLIKLSDHAWLCQLNLYTRNHQHSPRSRCRRCHSILRVETSRISESPMSRCVNYSRSCFRTLDRLQFPSITRHRSSQCRQLTLVVLDQGFARPAPGFWQGLGFRTGIMRILTRLVYPSPKRFGVRYGCCKTSHSHHCSSQVRAMVLIPARHKPL